MLSRFAMAPVKCPALISDHSPGLSLGDRGGFRFGILQQWPQVFSVHTAGRRPSLQCRLSHMSSEPGVLVVFMVCRCVCIGYTCSFRLWRHDHDFCNYMFNTSNTIKIHQAHSASASGRFTALAFDLDARGASLPTTSKSERDPPLPALSPRDLLPE